MAAVYAAALSFMSVSCNFMSEKQQSLVDRDTVLADCVAEPPLLAKRSCLL
jgi:hypothetical protein